MIFFTSDTHLGHPGCLEWRPWASSVEEMDEVIIAQWNEVVTDTDDVWHIGDFAWKDFEGYAARLNGRIHLVKGNHDPKTVKLEASGCFASVQKEKYLRHEGERFFLSHYAHRIWPGAERGAFHLYGHYHGDVRDVRRSMDIGIDAAFRLGYVVLDKSPIPWKHPVAFLSHAPATHRHPKGMEDPVAVLLEISEEGEPWAPHKAFIGRHLLDAEDMCSDFNASPGIQARLTELM